MDQKEGFAGVWLTKSFGSDKSNSYKHSSLVCVFPDNTYTSTTSVYGYSLISGYWKPLEENSVLVTAVYQFSRRDDSQVSRRDDSQENAGCLYMREKYDKHELVLGVGKFELQGETYKGNFKAVKVQYATAEVDWTVAALWRAIEGEGSKEFPDPGGYNPRREDSEGCHWWLVGGRSKGRRILSKEDFLADPRNTFKKFAAKME